MTSFKNSAKKIALTVFISFSITLVLFIVSILYGLKHIDRVNQSINTIVNDHNRKADLVSNMHNQARERVLSLFQMVLTDDPFVRDDLYLGLNKNGAEFARLRLSILDMLLSDAEEKILEEQGEFTAMAVPLQNQIIELVANDELEAARALLIEEGVPAQNKVLEKLGALVDLQRDRAASIFRESSLQFKQVNTVIFTMGIAASILGFMIALFASRKVYVGQQNLNKLNVNLESRVIERTQQLTQANAQLEKTIGELRRTQDYLIESEKLASLGSMVAGVAHELNTPLGNSVTAITTLQEKCLEFKSIFDDNRVKRHDLKDFLEISQEGSSLVMRNLKRANELVKSFKQVAIDQTSQKRRVFKLNEVLEEDISTLMPQFKKTPHKVELQINETIIMNSYPGPLGQVVINTVVNSLKHGFSSDMQGLVIINARSIQNDRVLIQITDNGEGIPDQNLKKVFDPFFTTKLGKGGSGLGMHIAYNIVTGLLGGDIKVTSQTGKGVNVEINLPLEAPEKNVSG